jgi:hypothetical protein
MTSSRRYLVYSWDGRSDMVILRLSPAIGMVTKDYRKGVYKWVRDRVIASPGGSKSRALPYAQRHTVKNRTTSKEQPTNRFFGGNLQNFRSER